MRTAQFHVHVRIVTGVRSVYHNSHHTQAPKVRVPVINGLAPLARFVTPGSLQANACPAPCTAFVTKRLYLGILDTRIRQA